LGDNGAFIQASLHRVLLFSYKVRHRAQQQAACCCCCTLRLLMKMLRVAIITRMLRLLLSHNTEFHSHLVNTHRRVFIHWCVTAPRRSLAVHCFQCLVPSQLFPGTKAFGHFLPSTDRPTDQAVRRRAVVADRCAS